MIYLIGGAPRCGKTTLAKSISKKFGIPWISTDMLEVVTIAYMTKKQWNKTHPYSLLRRQLKTNDQFYNIVSSQKIVNVLKQQAKSTFAAIDMAAISEIKDGNDYIIEGYHITPQLTQKLIKKYGQKNFKVIFLTKFDAPKFAINVHKSNTPNDWLLAGTKNKETFIKVGEMVSCYSHWLKKEAIKYGAKVLNMDQDFKEQLRIATNFWRSKR